MDPRPLTLRHLVMMAEGKSRLSWEHTASLMALVAAVSGDQTASAARFNPYTRIDKAKV